LCVPGSGTSLVKGIYDVNRRGTNGEYPGYLVGIAVKSDLAAIPTQPGADKLRIPSNTAQLTSLTAKYTWSPADKGTPTVTLEDRTFPISATVPAGDEMSFTAQILPGTKDVNAALAKGKSGTLTVEITMDGTLQNGSSISTTPSIFSVGVCTDCLSACDAADEVLSTPCGALAAGQSDGRVCTEDSTTTTTP
jgi:hypothetical protein